jgi:hypothetical protein
MIRTIAVTYAVFIAIAIAISWQLYGQPQTVLGSVGLAFSGATILQLALIFWFSVGWRSLWRRFPVLNRLLFPDLGGEWNIQIHWSRNGESGVVEADATIVQDFLRLSMEVRSPQSDSKTLIAQPEKDSKSGRPHLYYVYQVTTRALSANPSKTYHGAAILSFSEAGGGQLGGNYWTTEQTHGYFRLSRRG